MIKILGPALQEIDEAYEYYELQSLGLGLEFIDEFERAAIRIARFPDAWQSFSQNTRRCQLKRFPYCIVYQENKNEIVAVAHLHREPLHCAGRLYRS